MKPIVKVALLDTHDVSRHGIRAVLERGVPEVQIVNILMSRDELERSLCEKAWDVLLLDDHLPSAVDISRVVSLVRWRSPNTAIAVLSQNLQVAYFQHLFREGVKGFIYKGEQMEDVLLPAIRMVSQGQLYVSPAAARLPYENEMPLAADQLNPRDRQVLHLLKEGLTVKEIAKVLNLESKSVYRSRWRLKARLGVRTNEQIVAVAHTKGLL